MKKNTLFDVIKYPQEFVIVDVGFANKDEVLAMIDGIANKDLCKKLFRLNKEGYKTNHAGFQLLKNIHDGFDYDLAIENTISELSDIVEKSRRRRFELELSLRILEEKFEEYYELLTRMPINNHENAKWNFVWAVFASVLVGVLIGLALG